MGLERKGRRRVGSFQTLHCTMRMLAYYTLCENSNIHAENIKTKKSLIFRSGVPVIRINIPFFYGLIPVMLVLFR